MPQNLFNFRDLGGLQTHCQRKVRNGMLYRSGNLADVPDSSADFLVNQKNVGTYIDFRAPDEIGRFGRPETLLQRGVEWVNLHIDTSDPTFNNLTRPTEEDWVGLYVRLFEKNVGEWTRFIQLIRSAAKGVIYGCLFGKDRTGIATSFLLSQLNVRDEQILLDYSRTTQGMFPHYTRLRAIWATSTITEEETIKHYLTASPKIIEDFLSFYRSSAVQDLKHILSEIGEGEKKELQQKLLEPI